MNRTLEASGPVTGSFDITWNGNSLDSLHLNLLLWMPFLIFN